MLDVDSSMVILLECFRLEILVEYETDPEAFALQWLTAEQTAGRKHPYMFSQCQVSRSEHRQTLTTVLCLKYGFVFEKFLWIELLITFMLELKYI